MAYDLYFEHDTSTLYFKTASGAWNLQSEGWYQNSPTLYSEEPITETIDVFLTAQASHDTVIAYIQTLDAIRKYAYQYMHDPVHEHPVWLYAQTQGETNAHRTLVTNIEIEWQTPFYESDTDRMAKKEVAARLRVTRMPWWERTSERSMPAAWFRILGFDSGSEEVQPGETITGASSGNTAVVVGVVLQTGTWGGGTAAGYLHLRANSGLFQDNEDLNGPGGGGTGNNFATTDGTVYPSCIGMYDYTTTVDPVGDIPARVEYITFAPYTAVQLGRVWAGIRTQNVVSTPSYMPILWELETGTTQTDCSAATDGSNTASPYNQSGNDHIQITESAVDWDDGDFHKALEMYGSADIAAGSTLQALFGTHLLLMRAKIDSSTTWEVQLRIGEIQMADADFLELWKVEINTTSWDMYEMGTVTLPLYNRKVFDSSFVTANYELTDLEVQVWARRTSGSGDIYMDLLMPIPLDEGYLIIDGTGADATTTEIWYGQGPLPRDRQIAVTDQGTTIEGIYLARTHKFALPPGDGRLIVAFARQSSSVITDSVTINQDAEGHFIERWLNLRGSA